jgi:hypothetical protein
MLRFLLTGPGTMHPPYQQRHGCLAGSGLEIADTERIPTDIERG